MKWPFLKIVSKNASHQLEETLSGELGSHECYTNNLFPAIKWIKPFCTVNWRLPLFLFIYLFIYLFLFQVTALLRESTTSYLTRDSAVHHENDDEPSIEHQEHISPIVKRR